MDYGTLIGRAWRLTWSNRFLWVLGLFATTTIGACSPMGGGGGQVQWTLDPSDIERFYSPDIARSFQEPNPFLSQNITWILIAMALVAFLVGIAFLVVSFIAQGGMAEATGDLAMGREVQGGRAWAVGLRLFWRYLVLWLLILGLGILAALLAATLVGVAVALGTWLQGTSRTVVLVLGALVVLPVVLAMAVVFVAATVVIAFAQRAIAIEGTGAWDALAVGVRLLRRNLGVSALAWLVSLAISIGVGFAFVAAALALLIPLGALGFGLYSVAGVSVALGVYAALAIIVLVAGLWLVGGIANAFFWNYWTLIYLRLTGRLNPQLEPAG